jgi:hypothetical protein
MKNTLILAAALTVALSAPALAQRGPHHRQWGPNAYSSYGMVWNGSNYVVRDRDINRRLPNARNAQTGGRPNNPNLGPVDRSGNSPSDNR